MLNRPSGIRAKAWVFSPLYLSTYIHPKAKHPQSGQGETHCHSAFLQVTGCSFQQLAARILGYQTVCGEILFWYLLG